MEKYVSVGKILNFHGIQGEAKVGYSKNKEELHKLLFDLRDKFGLTIIIVTHDKELAALSDRIITMKDGKVTE